jgi:MraZ protein
MTPQSWLSGEHQAVLDPEARVLLPLGLRNLLNPQREEVTLMATLEPEGCVGIRRIDQWDAYVRQLRERAGTTLRARRVMLLLAATSAQVKVDRQGRLRLPDPLMAKAGIERPDDREAKTEVVIAGNFEDLRIWAAPRWEAFCAEALADYGKDLDWLQRGGDEGSPRAHGDDAA